MKLHEASALQDPLVLLEEPPLVDDDVAELFMMPEIKRELFGQRHDDELGFWRLLDQPVPVIKAPVSRQTAQPRRIAGFHDAA